MSEGQYNLTAITLSDKGFQPLQLNANGYLITVGGGSGTTADQVQGNVAAAATDSGNPVKVGGIYSSSLPTLTNGQRGNLQLTAKGAALVSLYTASGTEITFGAGAVAASTPRFTLASDDPLNAKFVGPFPNSATQWRYAAAASGIVNTTTAVTVKAADGSLCNYVSAMQVMWEALTTATEIAIRDGAAGTVLWRAKIPASLAGAREIVFPVPLKGTAATLLEVITLTASGAGAVYWDLQGFVAA